MSLITWNKKELMYGFIVIFLLMTMLFAGEIATFMIEQRVKEICPKGTITSVSPFGANLIFNTTPIDKSTTGPDLKGPNISFGNWSP